MHLSKLQHPDWKLTWTYVHFERMIHITFKKFEEWYLERKENNDLGFNLLLLTTLFYKDVNRELSGKNYKERKNYWKKRENEAKELVEKWKTTYLL